MTTPISGPDARLAIRPTTSGSAPGPAARPGAGDAFVRTAAEPARAPAKQVTGNGFGFAVWDPAAGGISKFYVHPYRFMAKNARQPRGEGQETANVLKKLAWAPATAGRTAEYVDQSQVIGATSEAGRESFLMPFGLQRSALITTLAGKEAALDLQWNQQVVSKQQIPGPAWVVKLRGVKETLVVVPLAGGKAPRFGKALTGAPGWAIVSVEDAKEAAKVVAEVRAWQGATPAGDLAGREAGELERWRVRPGGEALTEEERKLWRQSETVLRMGQVREPNGPQRSGSGLVLASLPDGEWFISWVRDMTYAVTAMARMGHQDEAKKALMAMLTANGTGVTRGPTDRPYQISTVRYFGNGAEEADYSGQAVRNVEYDSWGLALWAFGEYFKQFRDVAWLDAPAKPGQTVYGELKDRVVAPLLDKLEPCGDGLIVAADTSVWEQNDSAAKHYAFSTIAAIAGLRDFRTMAEAKGDQATVKVLDEQLAKLERGFNHAFVKGGELRGTLEASPRNDMDGALLEAINFGIVKDPALIKSTLDRMVTLRTASGGFRRVTGTTGYELQEFVFIDLALARALRGQGRTAEATAIERRLVTKANAQQSLIPEMYMSQNADDFEGPIGSPTGATPMVGYGAGAYILSMLGRRTGPQP
jgi:hypothetical protein